MAARKEEALDLDPIEPEGSKGKGGKSDKSDKGNSDKDKTDKGSKERSAGDKSGKRKGLEDSKERKRRDRDDDTRDRDDRDRRGRDEPERKPNPLMVGKRKVPYPPSPTDVPEGLTEYPASYTKQQNLLLAGLFVFLTFYIGAVLLSALVGIWCVWSFSHWPVLKVFGIVICGTTFLFLVKGFFKRQKMDKDMHIEITEDEHPLLFAFIHQICDELDAPEPNKVFVSPDVNAAVMPRTNLISLFVEPKKDLLIGLGLVNCLNLSEFKSVLAHEFGHFSQSATANSYAYVASRIIADLVEGEDWFDRIVYWFKSQRNVLSIIGFCVGAPLWVGRKLLWWFFKAITLQRMAVMRESEFHADLLAVKAAGSDAVVLSLFRMRFGNLCLMQAVQDMATAMDHKLYSSDMFLHQDRSAEVVRRKRKEPNLGAPPKHDHPMAGKNIRLFNPEDEDVTDEVPEMRRTHPPAYELEDNAKEVFIPAVVDYRSPWILFDEVEELKERMSYKFYRMYFRVPKNTELVSARKVQKFIDNEHAETTYDPKYKGAYDDRPLEPGEIDELNKLVHDSPWTDERMEKVLDRLYDGCEEHAEAHSELYKEMQALRSSVVGRPSPKMKKKMADIEKKQDENWEWFKSFDRRVYLLHVQMAAQVNRNIKEELVDRYRFQLEVQRLYQESRDAFDKADAYLAAWDASQRGEIDLPPDFAGEVIHVLRDSWKALKRIIKDAREINLPAMKNFEEGENLAEFILEEKMVPEPPLSYVKGIWIYKLKKQLHGVRMKCFRLHFKSVGGILRMHDEIATKWKAMHEPVAAEVVDVTPSKPVAVDAIPIGVVPNAPPAVVMPPAPTPAAPVAPSAETDEWWKPKPEVAVSPLSNSGAVVATVQLPPSKPPAASTQPTSPVSFEQSIVAATEILEEPTAPVLAPVPPAASATPPARQATPSTAFEQSIVAATEIIEEPTAPKPIAGLTPLDLFERQSPLPAELPPAATKFSFDDATYAGKPVDASEIFSLGVDDKPKLPAVPTVTELTFKAPEPGESFVLEPAVPIEFAPVEPVEIGLTAEPTVAEPIPPVEAVAPAPPQIAQEEVPPASQVETPQVTLGEVPPPLQAEVPAPTIAVPEPEPESVALELTSEPKSEPIVLDLALESTPEPKSEEPKSSGLSGIAPVPEPRVTPMVSEPQTSTIKPAGGKRPPIRITMVRPGETSPLAR